MDMLVGLLGGIFLSLWAWPVLFVIGLLLITGFGLAYEREGWVTGLCIVIVVGTFLAFQNHVSWWSVLMWTAGYIVIGVLMIYPLYVNYSRRKARDWTDCLERYGKGQVPVGFFNREVFLGRWYSTNLDASLLKNLNSNDWGYDFTSTEKKFPQEVRDNGAIAWKEYCKESMLNDWNNRNFILQVSETDHDGQLWDITHIKKYLVGQIILWMLYWPPYTLVMILRDFLRNLGEWIVERIGGHLRRISIGHFNAA